MSASSQPSDSTPRDSEPAPPPSQPPGASALWGDSDIGTIHDPVAAFATTQGKAPSDDQMPTIGHIGRYALKHKLGEGGLGTVFAAHDPLLSRLIAVKTLNLELDPSERDSFNALFLNEARAAAGLSHSHIVTVFDAGISDNRAYIAMELLKGRDLRQLRQEGWRPTPAQAALIVRRVADALAYAHSKGVVHRDVKPANIFMVGRTQPRVLDFGIARIVQKRESHQESRYESIAGPDGIAGSPYYMAPEQARQEKVDRRADVFSLGVVLYELLTDQKPFRGHTLDEIMESVRSHEPPLANKIDPNVPEALALIAARAMEKDPEHRYRSARAFARELRHWLDENAALAETDSDGTAQSAAQRWMWGGVAAAGLLLIGAALLSLSSSHRHSTRDANETAAAASAAVDSAPTAQPAASPLVSAAPEATAASAAPAVAASGVAVAAQADVVGAGGTVEQAAAASTAAAASAAAAKTAAKPTAAPKETAKERRAREAREREVKLAAAAPPATGTLHLAVSPWGQVEIDGKAAGTSPPLTELSLPQGAHQIVIRNADLPPYSTSVSVTAGQTATLKYKF
ncbi:MAG TPA: serine/threonine-protein kinase [Burkholderiaceae bacterium]